jgi:hypothetical protein
MRVKHRLSRTFANYLLSFAEGNATLPRGLSFGDNQYYCSPAWPQLKLRPWVSHSDRKDHRFQPPALALSMAAALVAHKK